MGRALPSCLPVVSTTRVSFMDKPHCLVRWLAVVDTPPRTEESVVLWGVEKPISIAPICHLARTG